MSKKPEVKHKGASNPSPKSSTSSLETQLTDALHAHSDPVLQEHLKAALQRLAELEGN